LLDIEFAGGRGHPLPSLQKDGFASNCE